MKLLSTIEALRAHRETLKGTVGFVPTMGALHLGHAALIQASLTQADHTLVSVFVNPTQFGPNEDFDRYPRTLDQDITLAQQAGADAVFAPTTQDMYPAPQSLSMHENVFSQVMCGASRPGHFDGVCLIVHKLLNLVQPTHAYFGQKDVQQLRIIHALVEQMHISTKVMGIPTIREPGGLALSSRNQYLSDAERVQAPVLYQTLLDIQNRYKRGQTDTSKLMAQAQQFLEAQTNLQLEYLDLRQWSDFSMPQKAHDQCFVALAAKLGTTRLIDNVFLGNFPLSH
jgi:pantoate--beta-alanine ligase